MPKILMIDEDQEILNLLERNLSEEGFQTVSVSMGETALQRVRQELPDLILLESFLASINGNVLVQQIKSDWLTRAIPIVLMTSQGEDADVIQGLNSGAADYITKPFSLRVLLARIRTILRRGEAKGSEIPDGAIRLKGITIWPDNYYVTVEGKSVSLARMEFEILVLLAQHCERYFTRTQIIELINREANPASTRSVDVHVAALRKKLGAYGGLIETVYSLGYRIRL